MLRWNSFSKQEMDIPRGGTQLWVSGSGQLHQDTGQWTDPLVPSLVHVVQVEMHREAWEPAPYPFQSPACRKYEEDPAHSA